jgi:hypothetical protein
MSLYDDLDAKAGSIRGISEDLGKLQVVICTTIILFGVAHC